MTLNVQIVLCCALCVCSCVRRWLEKIKKQTINKIVVCVLCVYECGKNGQRQLYEEQENESVKWIEKRGQKTPKKTWNETYTNGLRAHTHSTLYSKSKMNVDHQRQRIFLIHFMHIRAYNRSHWSHGMPC